MLIVRGDLRSETGWSRATRALLAAIKADFSSIIGIDLHFHSLRSRTAFPYPIVDDAAAAKLARQTTGSVVMHITLPSEIVRIPDALNLCWWFWETDTFSRNADWIERLDSLDAILVPSEWQADWLAQWNLKPPIFVLRWPHQRETDFEKATALGQLQLYRTWSSEEQQKFLEIDHRFHLSYRGRLFPGRLVALKQKRFDETLILLDAITKTHDGYFFAAQTDAPRKGLPILINEWAKYRSQTKTNKALVIRLSSLNVNVGPSGLVERFMNIARPACRRNLPALDHIFLLLDQVTDRVMRSLYASATAFVSPTYGEGFGSTIVEAAFAGSPFIAPDHTACRQLVPGDYRYKYLSYPYTGGLIDQLPIQPSNGHWHLPSAGAISDCMLSVETISTSERDKLVKDLRSHLADLLAPAEATQTFRAALAAAKSSQTTRHGSIQSFGKLS